MTKKLKLALVLAAALASPTIASAQDPSTRTDLTIIGAVLTDESEPIADTTPLPAAELPAVYEDETAAATEASATDASANLSHAVETEQAR